MRCKITKSVVASATPKLTPFQIHDSELKGFLLRVKPSGARSYYLEYRTPEGRRLRFRLAEASKIDPDQARTLAKIAAGDVDIQSRKKDQRQEFDRARQRTLEVFLDEQYEPWAKMHLKSVKPLLEALRADFKAWMGKPMTDINRWLVEGWRKGRLEKGRSPVTVNRAVQRIHGTLSKAVEWSVIDRHPFTGLKPLETDKRGRVRFLSADDEARLRTALIKRETELRAQRDRFNEWRVIRHIDVLPTRDRYFVDYIRPIVLLAMNTGLRRAGLLGLKWADVDLHFRLLTVTGAIAKNRQSRHIPLNAEALDVLSRWKNQRVPASPDQLVFGGRKGE
ncbi:MAG TPA: integrase family protein [Steroidobacteraceae bacterium]|jgi:integrase